jgi:DNA-binding CsgD family transcriptional regulator/tetratricopeptide (TPR) repeat protein
VIVRPVLCRPFIGRQRELAYLRERRLEAGRSHGGLVLVTGDAGVGKTRLVSEFCKSLAYSRWKLGVGACLEFASRPYGPILEALARLDSTPLELGAAETKREQFDAIVERFAAIAARNALILVVEDLHWADAATLDLLSYLGTKLHHMRILVVASVRADELHPDHLATSGTAKIARNARAGQIELGPLKGSELQRFIDEALSGVELPDEVRREVAIAGDGNPFYTEELLKSAVEQRRERLGAGLAKLPSTVRTALLERLKPFDEDERRIVTQAAVIGRTFGLDLLAATLEAEPRVVLAALRRARDFQIVEEIAPKLFRFRHGLTRDAFYGEFLGAELQPRHRAIALALEGARDARSLEALAYHWWAAREYAKAAEYNEMAGEAAVRVYAHEDAIAFFERALECGLDPCRRAAIVKKVGDCRSALGSTKEAQAAYAAAADIYADAGARELEAACRVSAAITAYIVGLPNPIAPLDAMLARLDASEYLAVGRLHLGIAWLAATFSFPTRALGHLDRIDPRALDEAADIALRFHNVAAFVAMEMGDLETFRREQAAWVAASETSGSIQTVAIALINGAMCRAFFGLHDEAQQDLDRALALTREARSHSEEAVHSFGALCALLRGDLASARSELEYVSPASENRVNVVFATAWGSVVGAAMDDRALIERWFDGFEATMAAAPEVECGGGFAEIMVRRGRRADAAAILHRALPECEMLRGNIITLLAIARYGTREDRDRARGYLDRAAAGTRELPERPALALFDAIELRRAGRAQESAEQAREAAAGFRRLGYLLFAAAALEEAGEIEAASELFRRCGAAYDVRRLEGKSHPRGRAVDSTARDAASLLSAREREIAVLAASGQSNLEIARKLSITHKTVEKHLGSAYQKLQISSRAQLDPYVRAAKDN